MVETERTTGRDAWRSTLRKEHEQKERQSSREAYTQVGRQRKTHVYRYTTKTHAHPDSEKPKRSTERDRDVQ